MNAACRSPQLAAPRPAGQNRVVGLAHAAWAGFEAATQMLMEDGTVAERR